MRPHYLQTYLVVMCYAIALIELVNADPQRALLFPDGFTIGASTSAYQVEGAWDHSDKGESIWDRYVHTQPDKISNGDNGDVACDSFNNFKKDVQLLRKIGLKHYRFSLSWSRILPTGSINKVSKTGIQYYSDLLDELAKYNIKAFVTIYHWDHPQVIEDHGGWTNETIVNLFADYARLVYKKFARKVKTFITINEPSIFCSMAYYHGILAPGRRLGRSGEYLCGHNMLKAHAKAYHIYKNEFEHKYHGRVGISLMCPFYYSKNGNDKAAEEMAFQYNCGRYAAPIFSETGDYPEIIKRRIAQNSKYEGLEQSRLPVFSREWINYIKGSADFFGLNHHTSFIVESVPMSRDTIYINDDGIHYSFNSSCASTATGSAKLVPKGFRDILRKIKDEYGNPPLIVTENGVDDAGALHDSERQEYHYSYMKAMLQAIYEDKCYIQGYTIWSLMDNFEWFSGYSRKSGIYAVDFNDPNRSRTAKSSTVWLANVLRSKKLQPILV